MNMIEEDVKNQLSKYAETLAPPPDLFARIERTVGHSAVQRRIRRSALIAVAAAIVAVVGAAVSVGATRNPQPSGAAHISRAEFIARANAICRRAAADPAAPAFMAANNIPASSDEVVRKDAESVTAFIPAIGRTQHDFSLLPSPPGDEQLVAAIEDFFVRMLAWAEHVQAALQSGDLATMRSSLAAIDHDVYGVNMPPELTAEIQSKFAQLKCDAF